jgi:uncharacterized protein
MILHECQMALEKRLSLLESIPPPGYVLSSCAREISGMVAAYYQDGMAFLSHQDLPNALACFSYALGWMDAGICMGLLSSPAGSGLPLIPRGISSQEISHDRLPEKTARYRVLLSRACMSLVPAPETDTCTRSFSERILVIAEVFYAQGILWEESGDRDSALAAYSYGFGWLDAGVRSGLFRITGNRELFTI